MEFGCVCRQNVPAEQIKWSERRVCQKKLHKQMIQKNDLNFEMHLIFDIYTKIYILT